MKAASSIRARWSERKTTAVAYFIGGMLAGIAMATCIAPAHASEGPDPKVIVCKYVGQPGDDEVLQTGQNPIAVSQNALEGDGFAGVFPFEFSDAQGYSVAIRYATGPTDNGEPGECITSTPTPTPTETPSPTDTPTPTPTETVPPKHSHTPTWTPTWTPTNPGPGPGNHRLAMTGSDAERYGAIAGLLAALGLGATWFARRRSA